MAELIESSKDFRVLKLKREEARKAGWGINELGDCLCMHCNNIIDPDNIYYPVVLGDTMCPKCYIDWHRGACNYPEDREVEENRMRRLYKTFNITD